jgi:hypothetical protein
MLVRATSKNWSKTIGGSSSAYKLWDFDILHALEFELWIDEIAENIKVATSYILYIDCRMNFEYWSAANIQNTYK